MIQAFETDWQADINISEHIIVYLQFRGDNFFIVPTHQCRFVVHQVSLHVSTKMTLSFSYRIFASPDSTADNLEWKRSFDQKINLIPRFDKKFVSKYFKLLPVADKNEKYWLQASKVWF